MMALKDRRSHLRCRSGPAPAQRPRPARGSLRAPRRRFWGSVFSRKRFAVDLLPKKGGVRRERG